VHVDDSIDPVRDLETITAEICIKDKVKVDQVRKEKEDAGKRDSKMGPKPIFIQVFDKLQALLAANTPLRLGDWNLEEIACINDNIPNCLTLKPIVYLVNLDSASYKRQGNKWLPKIKEWIDSHGGGIVIPFSVEWEQGLWNTREDPVAREAYLGETPGLTSAIPRIVKVGYRVLNLQYYFTAGEDEVRAWTIPAGALAPEAAGVIHTDFERGFIKAEVVAFDDFKELCDGKKSYANIKAAGKYRQEGKQYVVKDGDIIHFMFNVTAPKKDAAKPK